MKKLALLALVVVLSATACKKEKDTKVIAQMSWTDDDNLELNDGWKASIYKEALNFINDADYSKEVLETKDVKLKDATVEFVVQVADYENYTVVVFHDDNNNNKFDKGENAAVEYDMVESGEDKSMSLTIEY